MKKIKTFVSCGVNRVRRQAQLEVIFLSDPIQMQAIAHIRSDFRTKFGIPRQSGLVESLHAAIVFEPPFRDENAVRGLEGFSHLWLLWHFSETAGRPWSPTVRPPRLGGNRRIGVFATRSPFRPNPIGLSCVQLERVELHPNLGPVLHVRGADLMDGTPILDVKPYLPYADSRPAATAGFTAETPRKTLHVVFPPELLRRLPEQAQAAAVGVLEQDPRPATQSDSARIYGMPFAGFDIRFRVCDDSLTVVAVEPL